MNGVGTLSCTSTISSASALVANGTNCGIGQAALGVDSAGNAEGCWTPSGGITLPVTSNLLKGNGGGGAAAFTGTNTCGAGSASNYMDGSGTLSCTSTISNASALVANGTNCGIGQAAVGVDSGGNAEGCWTPLGALSPLTATVLGGVKGNGTATACVLPFVATGFDAAGALQCAQPTNVTGSAATLSGTVSMSNGGTNSTATPGSLGGVAFYNSTGTKIDFTTPGPINYVFVGTGGAPSFSATVPVAALPVTTVAKGGTNLTTISANETLVGSGLGIFSPSLLPSCSNATTSKLLYDNTTRVFSCGTDQTTPAGATVAGTTMKLAAPVSSAVTNSLVSLGLGLTIPANATFGFHCVISTTRAAITNGPRYAMVQGVAPARISWNAHVGLAATTETITKMLAVSTTTICGTCTTAMTAGTVAQVMDDEIVGTGTQNATGGTLSLHLAPSATGAVTAQAGSYCIWY
jgi:hypothetical protein